VTIYIQVKNAAIFNKQSIV